MTLDRLPGQWAERGACVGANPDIFFPVRGGDLVDALSYCERCEVRAECYLHGLYHERFGVWGGSSERQRRRARRDAGIRVVEPEPLLTEVMSDAS